MVKSYFFFAKISLFFHWLSQSELIESRDCTFLSNSALFLLTYWARSIVIYRPGNTEK